MLQLSGNLRFFQEALDLDRFLESLGQQFFVGDFAADRGVFGTPQISQAAVREVIQQHIPFGLSQRFVLAIGGRGWLRNFRTVTSLQDFGAARSFQTSLARGIFARSRWVGIDISWIQRPHMFLVGITRIRNREL